MRGRREREDDEDVPLISTCSRMFCELGEKNGQLFFDSRVRVAVKPMDCRDGIVLVHA